jgi:acyl-CoA synthetase (NDP forming)
MAGIQKGPKKKTREKAAKKKKKAKTAPVEVHPWTKAALEALVKKEDGTFSLDPKSASALDEAFAPFLEDKDALIPAVKAVVALAHYLHAKRASPAPSQALLQIAKSAIPALEKLGLSVQEILNKDGVDLSGVDGQVKKLLGGDGKTEADPRLKEPAKGKRGMLGFLGNFDDS